MGVVIDLYTGKTIDNVEDIDLEETPEAEEDEEWLPIYVCECENPYFYVTPDGPKCASDECGEYIDFDNY